MDNPEEIEKFLETHSLSKWNQEETDNLNRLITRSEIESVIKNKQTNKQKIPCKQKTKTEWLHWGIVPNIQRRTYTYPSQTLPKD